MPPRCRLALTAGAIDDAAAWCILAVVRPDAPLSASLLALVLALFSLSAFAMDAIGIHAVFGGFLLGAVLPRGALTEKLRINIGLQAGVILPGLFSILVLMTILSTLMATPLFNWVERERRVGRAAEAPI